MTVAAFFPILFDFYRNSLLSSFVDSGGGPNNIPDGIVPGKTFYMRGFTVLFMFSNISCEFSDFESL